jgi:protein-L-isoaspartate(D-aspartate) O-methyltransferase
MRAPLLPPLLLAAAVASGGCRSVSRRGSEEAASAERGDAAAELSRSPDSAPSAPSADADPPGAQAARERLVRSIERSGEPWGGAGPWDPRVLDAMRKVPRHLFMEASLGRAYADSPQPIGHGQTISQPMIVAIMTQALELRGDEKVLEIGTGSGYQAAVLSLLTRQVRSIEIVEPLGQSARERLERLGYRNVEVRIGDGYKGWPEQAPFDRIILTAAPPKVPQPLFDQLRDGGVLIAPVGETGSMQELVRWRKQRGQLQREDLGAVRFVPMVPGD